MNAPVTAISTRIQRGTFAIAIAVAGLVALSQITPVAATTNEVGLSPAEEAAVAFINSRRIAIHAGPLTTSDTLTAAARWMAQDLAERADVSHTDSIGRGPYRRAVAFGYPPEAGVGENLVVGVAEAGAVIASWLASPAHRDNLQRAEWRAIGIARVRAPATGYEWYWVAVFGTHEDAIPSIPAWRAVTLAVGWNRVSWTGVDTTLRSAIDSAPDVIEYAFGWDRVGARWRLASSGDFAIQHGDVIWIYAAEAAIWMQPVAGNT